MTTLMKPLYQPRSGSRNETKTQVGNNWESMYDGGDKLLGHIWSESWFWDS